MESQHSGWYRYDRLFAEMLSAGVAAQHPAAHLPILRRAHRSGTRNQGRPTEAIELAFAAGDSATAARLIVLNTQYFNSQGQLPLVRGWLEQLRLRTSSPAVRRWLRWRWVDLGVDRGRSPCSTSHCGSPKQAPSTALCGWQRLDRVGRAAGSRRARPDGVDRMLVDAERAVALELPGSYWHTQAALLLGAAHLANGTEQEALRWFEHAAQFSAEHQRPGASTALAELALLAADRADWPMARTYHRESADHIARRPAAELHAHPALPPGGARVALHAARSTGRAPSQQPSRCTRRHPPPRSRG
jgi:hypothetical protein